MDANPSSFAWQIEILRAFQTWAVQANINIGLVADGGQAFGVSGPTQHDPRFGDVRIGGHRMSSDALSISVPHGTTTGTWSGDLFLNTDVKFDGDGPSLFAAALHEAGHILGLPHSTDPTSPMYSHYNSNVALTQSDIQALKSLYGTRAPDRNERLTGVNNDTPSGATPFVKPGKYDGSIPLIAYGDLQNAQDVDYFVFQLPGKAPSAFTVKLQSAGRSLLAPRVTLIDESGRVVAIGEASSGLGDVVTLKVNPLGGNGNYTIKVEGATEDVFGIGGYSLAVTFGSKNQVTAKALNKVLTGPYESLEPDDVYKLLKNPNSSLLNDDEHEDDEPLNAFELDSSPGYVDKAHYEILGSLSDSTDLDVYLVDSPEIPGRPLVVLTASARAVGSKGIAPRIVALDEDLRPIPSRILANGFGTFTVQVENIRSGDEVFLKLLPSASGKGIGNYGLSVDFVKTPTRPPILASDSLGAGTRILTYNLYIARSQLFQFLLKNTAAGGATGDTVGLSLTDSKGKSVHQILADLNDTAGGSSVFLAPGTYQVRVSVNSASSQAPDVAFTLEGDTISDPIGPALDDPTLTPVFVAPDMPGVFLYPGDIFSLVPYYLARF